MSVKKSRERGRSIEPAEENPLRSLPSVEEVVHQIAAATKEYPASLVVSEARRALSASRAALRSNLPSSDPAQQTIENLSALARPSLRKVINATGVVLHTNLGRAPLPPFEPILGYSNLEYDLAEGKRGKRDSHLAGILEALLHRPAIVVNNNAAAVFLALHELACGHEVIVSRGELIEIGDGFRIPEIMARSGAILREVGTTNRTSLNDYGQAINERTKLILRVHPSNFHISGFTAKPKLQDLARLAHDHRLPIYEDLGSGCVVDLQQFGIEEPLASDSLAAGVDVISFSTDKLLGGPQSGILAGDPELIARIRRNPMYRALRPDKLIIQALATALSHVLLGRTMEIPSLRMIAQPAAEIRERAAALLQSVHRKADLVQGESVIGGGSTPAQSQPTWLISIQFESASKAEQMLRQGDPPVIARIESGNLLFDLRTVQPEEEQSLAAAINQLP